MAKELDKKSEIQSKLGKIIKNRRKELNIFQTDIANELGISQAYYSYIERAERDQDFYLVWRICQLLQIPFYSIVAVLADNGTQDANLTRLDAISKIDNRYLPLLDSIISQLVMLSEDKKEL